MTTWIDPANARSVMTASPQYLEGRQAFADDKQPVNNPYRIHTVEAEAWDHGWWDAYEEADD